MKINTKLLAVGVVVAAGLLAPFLSSAITKNAVEEKLKTITELQSYGAVSCSYAWNPTCSIQDVVFSVPATRNSPATKFQIKEVSVSNIKDFDGLKNNTYLQDGKSLHSTIIFSDVKFNGERLAWNENLISAWTNKGIDTDFLNGFVKDTLDSPTSLILDIDAANKNGAITQFLKIAMSHDAFTVYFDIDVSYKLNKARDGLVGGKEIVISKFSTGLKLKDQLLPQTLYEMYKIDLAKMASRNVASAIRFNERVGGTDEKPISYDAFLKAAEANVGDLSKTISGNLNFPKQEELVTKFQNMVLGKENSIVVGFENKDNLNLDEMTKKWMVPVMTGDIGPAVKSLNIDIK